MRRASKVDATHAAIRDTLRTMGCVVADTSGAGNGFPDLVVKLPSRIRYNKVLLVEIKDGSLPPSARKLTPAQVAFHREWGASVVVLTSVDEAVALVTNGR